MYEVTPGADLCVQKYWKKVTPTHSITRASMKRSAADARRFAIDPISGRYVGGGWYGMLVFALAHTHTHFSFR